jgi:hypothetical protein
MRKVVAATAIAVLSGAILLSDAPDALGQLTPHLVVIMFENKNYSQVVGSPYAPYINDTLIPSGELFTHYYSAAHPSTPNYLILTSGHAAGCVTDTCLVGSDTQENLFHQMDTNSIGWKAYEESMPSACYPTDLGKYIAHHNPPLYFSNLGGQSLGSSCMTNDVPYAQLSTDIGSGSFPAFSFVAPDKFDDMHNDQKGADPTCKLGSAIPDEVCQGDVWLQANLPTILSDGGQNDVTALIVWDEASKDGSGGGGQVPLILVGPNVTAGSQQNAPFTHYGLENAIAGWFGLPELHPAVPSL